MGHLMASQHPRVEMPLSLFAPPLIRIPFIWAPGDLIHSHITIYSGEGRGFCGSCIQRSLPGRWKHEKHHTQLRQAQAEHTGFTKDQGIWIWTGTWIIWSPNNYLISEQVQWPRGRNSTRDKKAVRMLENTSGFTQLTTGHRSWLLVFLSFNLCACVYHRCSGACGARRGKEILRNWSCKVFVRSQAWEL